MYLVRYGNCIATAGIVGRSGTPAVGTAGVGDMMVGGRSVGSWVILLVVQVRD
jgi:hypothetical protein